MTHQNEPIHDIAHLGHIELLTPKLEETRRFFVDVMGMYESGRQGDSIFLRGWDDYEHHSLQLTASEKPGLGHFAFRTMSPQALQRRVGERVPNLFLFNFGPDIGQQRRHNEQHQNGQAGIDRVKQQAVMEENIP